MSFSLQMQNVSHLHEMTTSSVCVCIEIQLTYNIMLGSRFSRQK